MQRHARTLLTVLGVCIWIHPLVLGEDIDRMTQAWEKRNVESVSLHWTENVTYGKGTIGGRANKLIPPKDLNFIRKCEIELQDDMARYSWAGLDWQPVANQFEEETYTLAFDGKVARDLYSNHRDGRSSIVYPVGFIENSDSAHRDCPFPVISFAFRGKTTLYLKMFNTPVATTKRIGVEEIKGTRCIKFEQVAKPHVRTIYVDPAKEYTIKRCLVEFEGEDGRLPSVEWIASYKLDPKSGKLVPSAWVMKRWVTVGDVLRVAEHIEAVVTFRNVGHQIPAERFRLSFPFGTVVRNDIVDEDFLVRKDGEFRKILSVERRRGASYEDLLMSDTGEAGL